jgi:iron complex outermembrane receptor protein
MNLNKTPITLAVAAALTGALPAIADDFAIEEVVVTARHKAESLQSTPIAVSAFGAEQMKEAKIDGLGDIAGRVPGFQMNAYNAAEPELFMRGIGSDIESAGAAAAIGVYIDGVYISRGTGATGDLFDLERVEVLRGPQGTLYGKNVVGGAVNFITRKPNTEEAEGSLELTVGDYNLLETKAYYTAPLSDTLAGKVAVTALNRDGYGKNTYTGNDAADAERYSARGQLLFSPSSDLEILLSADTSVSHGTPRVKHIGYAEWRNQAFISSNPREDLNSEDGFEDSETGGISLKVDWESDFGTLTSITAYRKNDYSIYENAAAGLVDATQVFDPWGDPANNTVADHDALVALQPDDEWLSLKEEDSTQFSQEFRLQGGEGDLSWLLGLYYMVEEIDRNEEVDYWFDTPWGTTAGNQGNQTNNETTSTAVFAQATYDLTEKLAVTAGIRWSEDKKDFGGLAYGRRFDNWDNLHEDLDGNRVESYTFETSDSWDAVTPSLTIDYQATDDVFLYFSMAKGYKAGGYNGEGMEKAVEAITPFEPEFALNHEVGFKTQWYDNRLRVNGAVFYTEYTDIQSQVWVETGPNTPDNLQVLNGSGEATGLELEVTALVTENLTITGSYGQLRSVFTDDLIVDDENLKDNEMRRTPENSLNLAATYEWALADIGDASLRLDYQFQDKYYFDNSNDPITEVGTEFSIDASFTLRSFDDAWSLKLWGKNLTDELNLASTTVYAAYDDTAFNAYQPPRTFGLTGIYNF